MLTLDTIINLIEENISANEIHETLERCIESFGFQISGNINRHEFNNLITLFYRNVQDSLNKAGTADKSQAFEEVIWLIENDYESPRTGGYDSAYYDAFREGSAGIILILKRLAEIIKRNEQIKRISWLIVSAIDPSDWHLKQNLVEEILEKFGELLHPDLRKLSPAQLTPYLEELIYDVVFLYSSK